MLSEFASMLLIPAIRERVYIYKKAYMLNMHRHKRTYISMCCRTKYSTNYMIERNELNRNVKNYLSLSTKIPEFLFEMCDIINFDLFKVFPN
jgi:hypothetical protein